MFLIPGQLIALLTFPGVIVHELAHQFFCRLCNVAVFEVKYFQMKNPAGYVVHEIPSKVSQSFIISIGPFIINTILGALIACPAAIPILKFGSQLSGTDLLVNYFLIWLGVSIAMHSFPSTGDAKSLWEHVKKKGIPAIYRIILAPVIGLIYIGAFGSVIWLDLIYGAAVAMLIPNLLIYILA